jgi:hypothetical protein
VQEHRTKRDQSCEEGRVRTLTCHRFLVVARTTAPATARATWGDVMSVNKHVRECVSPSTQELQIKQVCSHIHTHTNAHTRKHAWPQTCSIGRPRLTTSSHATSEARALRTCIASSTPRPTTNHHQQTQLVHFRTSQTQMRRKRHVPHIYVQVHLT